MMGRVSATAVLVLSLLQSWGECFTVPTAGLALGRHSFSGVHRHAGSSSFKVGFGNSASKMPASVAFSPLSLRKGRPNMAPMMSGISIDPKDNPTPTPRGAITHAPRVTVMGGGNFGLCLALVLSSNRIPVTMLVRRQEIADILNKEHKHPNYLNGMELPKLIYATAKGEEAFKDATYILHAVPTQYSRSFLRNVKEHIPETTSIICVSKGIETDTLSLMKDILVEETGTLRELAFLSGPSFAKEIAAGMATAVTVASESDSLCNEVVELFANSNFKVFTSNDVMGIEIGGAVKNVIAISAGMCEGLGLGTNAMSALITRGCLEMTLVAKAVGGKRSTMMGLAGVGDTFGTCFGPLSRNRQLGYRLGKGEKLEDILGSSTEVAEGYATSLSLVDYIDKKLPDSFRKDLKFPILYGVASILKGETTPLKGMQGLMTLPIRSEVFDYDE